MSFKIKLGGKGKKRALDTPTPNFVGDNEPPHPTKRPKRAETRQCPICDEHIPLRLLAKHAELESERVDDIMSNVGSRDVDDQYFNEWAFGEPGPSTRRLSALKARKSLSSSFSSPTLSIPHSVAFATQTIQQIKRHRKVRHTRLKELLKADVDGEGEASGSPSWVGRFTGEEIDCPVCEMKVRGDKDVVNAHVDACLVYEGQRADEALEREREREAETSLQWDDEDDVEDTGTYVGNLRGAGFQTRSSQHADVDHEIDIEGDDQAVFGAAQFTEGDVVPGQQHPSTDEEAEVNIEDDEDDNAQLAQQTLRDLVAAGKRKQEHGAAIQAKDLVRDHMILAQAEAFDVAIAVARQRDDKTGLIAALQNKIKHLESGEPGIDSASTPQHHLCRICLDPYTDPTVSTGCWHTCCKECWLRCLGSTKLCPICKRITCATDLRRIYL